MIVGFDGYVVISNELKSGIEVGVNPRHNHRINDSWPCQHSLHHAWLCVHVLLCKSWVEKAHSFKNKKSNANHIILQIHPEEI
jgi:hypothetical protein